jgi:hypothetical protein
LPQEDEKKKKKKKSPFLASAVLTTDPASGIFTAFRDVCFGGDLFTGRVELFAADGESFPTPLLLPQLLRHGRRVACVVLCNLFGKSTINRGLKGFFFVFFFFFFVVVCLCESAAFVEAKVPRE